MLSALACCLPCSLRYVPITNDASLTDIFAKTLARPAPLDCIAVHCVSSSLSSSRLTSVFPVIFLTLLFPVYLRNERETTEDYVVDSYVPLSEARETDLREIYSNTALRDWRT